MRWLRAADRLVVGPDATVVCLIHDDEAPADTAAALLALEKHTPVDVPVVVVGPPLDYDFAGTSDRERFAVKAQAGSPLGELVLEVERLAAPADLALMCSACRVPPRWLERLRAAAQCDDLVATATPLSHFDRTLAVSEDASEQTDALISASALSTRPRLLIGGPDCLYVRRRALQLIGGVPPAQTTLEALTAALCEACVGAGMVNVLADDLYVGCDCRDAPATDLPGARLRNMDRADERSALQRALAVSRAAVAGLSVTIDGRSLGPSPGGTQLYTLELALALARSGRLAVRVVIGPDISVDSHRRLSEADGIEVVSYDQVIAGVEKSDIVHRPQQVFTADDLNLLQLLGRRLVVTHQDLIAYHNCTYHSSFETWEQYRRVTRVALAAADRIVFFSEHSLRDAEAEDLVGRERADVVGVALGDATRSAPRRPLAAPADREFIFCLAPDYKHKNRRFAIELVAALRSEQDWPGLLVLAGAHVAHGSSRADERQLLAEDPSLRDAVIDVGQIDDAERRWLLANARAVLVPSVVEGFGLVPLEAAHAGQPCLFAAQTSLREVLSSSLATLVPWDASASAAGAKPLLSPGLERHEHVLRLRSEAARWNWQELAGQLVASYERALRAPYRAAAVRAWQELERERYLVEVDRDRQRVSDVLASLGDSIALASDDGFLTPSQQRGLLRVGSRPALNRLLLWPFAVLGSLRGPADKHSVS